MKNINYDLSKDYAKLNELILSGQRVAGWIELEDGTHYIAEIRYNQMMRFYNILSRGRDFDYWKDKGYEGFLRVCAKYNLSYMIPNE